MGEQIKRHPQLVFSAYKKFLARCHEQCDSLTFCAVKHGMGFVIASSYAYTLSVLYVLVISQYEWVILAITQV